MIFRKITIGLNATISILIANNAQFALPTFQALQKPHSFCDDCALYFDGPGSSDHVSINGGQNGGSHTFEAWLKRIDSGARQSLLMQGNNSGIKVEQYNNSNKLGFTRYGSYDYKFNHYVSSTSGSI